VLEARSAFLDKQHLMQPEDLVFIDESGCHPGIGPLRGWAPRGKPLVGPEQVYARKQHVSIIGAISIDGLLATSTVRGGVGSRQFRRFVENKLLPALRPGQVVCMDNLNAHKSPRIRSLIEKAGARVLFLPPYSPDFNPIEAAWAKLKTLVRKYAASSVDTLRQAIYRACRHISAADARGWFRYCGYNT